MHSNSAPAATSSQLVLFLKTWACDISCSSRMRGGSKECLLDSPTVARWAIDKVSQGLISCWVGCERESDAVFWLFPHGCWKPLHLALAQKVSLPAHIAQTSS